MNNPVRRALAGIAAFVIALSGCAIQEEPPAENEVLVVEEVIVEEAPRHPLTGVELGTTVLEGPSIAVKIDNTSSGRPQVGIAAADLVFEELVEGGVTRYLAVFHTAIPSEVGPVRSGRPQDAGLVGPIGGVFVFSGVGNANVREIIRATGIATVEHDTSSGTPEGEFFFRSSRKPAPWNLHIEAQELVAVKSTIAVPNQQFQYKTDPAESSAVVSGDASESLSALFSSGVDSRWERDEATGLYLKFLSNGSPDTDADGTQISATNVIVMSPNYVDVEGLPTAQITGNTDRAFIATGGFLLEGRFDATVAGAPTLFTDLDGNAVYLAPGKTFVLLPPGEASTAGGVKPGQFQFELDGQTVTINL